VRTPDGGQGSLTWGVGGGLSDPSPDTGE